MIDDRVFSAPRRADRKGESVPKTNIRTERVAPISGRYVAGKEVTGGRTVFVSGQLAETLDGQRPAAGDAEAEARQIFSNIRAILNAAGGDLQDIVKLGIYLTDIEDRAAVAKVRAEFFTDDEALPTSTMVEVSRLIYPDCKVEVDAVAVID